MKKLAIVLMLSMSVMFLSGCGTKNNAAVSNAVKDEVQTEMVTEPEAFDADIKNNSLAISPDEKIAVVSNSTIDKIKVYDIENKKQIGELDEFVTPRNISFSKDGKHFYVSDSSYGSVREFDSRSLNNTRSFDLEKGVFGFVISNSGKKMYVNNQHNSTVTVISLRTGEIEKIIEGFSNPRQGIVIDDSDKYIYVTNFKGNDVRVVNTETFEIEKTLSGIPSVRGISVDKDNKFLYGASSSENSINVIDISSGEVVKTIPVGKEPFWGWKNYIDWRKRKQSS